jgi:hypothetical protein
MNRLVFSATTAPPTAPKLPDGKNLSVWFNREVEKEKWGILDRQGKREAEGWQDDGSVWSIVKGHLELRPTPLSGLHIMVVVYKSRWNFWSSHNTLST